MAGRSDIEAGRAFVTLYVQNSSLLKGLAVAKKAVDNLAARVVRLGGLMLALGVSIQGPLLAALRRFEATGSALKDMADRTGMSVEALAELEYAANQTGGAIADVEGAVRTMQKNLQNKATGEALRELGLSIEDLKKQAPDKQFEAIGLAIARIKDPTERAAKAQELFGKSGTKLLPMLAAMKELREEAVRLGRPTQQEAELADQLGDALGRIRTMASNVVSTIASTLAPTYIRLAEVVEGVLSAMQRWVRENGELIRILGRVSSALIVAGGAIYVFGRVLRGATAAFTVMQLALIPGAIALGKLRSLFTSVSGVALTAAQSIRRFATNLAAIGSQAGGHLSTILRGLLQLGFGLVQAGASAGRSLVVGLINEARTLGPLLFRAMSAAANLAATALTPLARRIGDSLHWAFAQARVRIQPLLNAITPQIRAAFLRTVIAVMPVLTRLQSVWTTVSTAGRVAITGIASAWRAYGPAIAQGLSTAVVGAFNRIRGVGLATARAIAAGSGNIGRGLGGVFAGVGGLLGMFGSGAGGLLGSLAGVMPQLLMLGSSLTMLINPATLLIGAIAGGVYAWTRFSDSGRKALASVIETLRPFKDIAVTTVQGIRDAFAAGDMQLAGEIAIAGLRAAFLSGMVLLSDALGSIWGDTLGQFASQLAGGDFAGAWKTAIDGMAAVWDAWSEGVVTTFTNAIRAVVDVWKAGVGMISDFLLEASAKGGALGKIASGILGVDMSDENQRAAYLAEHGDPVIRRNEEAKLRQHRELLAKAEAEGNAEMAEKQRKAIEAQEKVLARLGVSTGPAIDPLEAAKQAAREQTGSTVDAIKKALDEIDADAAARTNNGADRLADNAGGVQRARDAAEQAKRDLEEAVANASRAAEAARARGGDAAGGFGDIDLAAAKQPASAVTFSATALQALGGGSTQERIARATEMTAAQQAAVLNKLDKQREALEKLNLGLA